MSDDIHGNEEVVEHSWGSRLWQSIKGVGLGFLLFIGSFYFLFWNEGRALQTYQSLDEGLGAVVSISDSEVHDNNDGKLVHLTGMATSDQQLKDEQFKVSVKALQLFRHTEMFQWQETIQEEPKKKVGGGTRTVKEYRYNKIWSSELIDSKKFNQRGKDKQNPSHARSKSQAYTAKDVLIGAFALPVDMVKDIDNSADVAATEKNIPDEFRDDMVVDEQGDLLWGDEEEPQVGDIRISFSQTPATEVTVVAQQTDGSFGPFQTKAGDELKMLKRGKFTASEMFENAESQNSTMTWILRVVGIVAMIAGLKLILGPMAVVMDFIPIVGGIVQLGATIVSVVLGTSLSLMTIGTAWITYRPLIGIPLFIVSAGAMFVLFKKRKRKPKGETETGEAGESEEDVGE